MKNPFDKWQLVKVSALQIAPWNYKEQDEELQKKLSAGIKKNGMLINLIVREVAKGKFEIVNGNHRYPVLLEQKISEVMCYNLGKVKLEAAQRIAIETNEISFETNSLKLSELIRGISVQFKLDDLLETMPYNAEHIESMLKVEKFDINEYTKHKEPIPENFQVTSIPPVPPTPSDYSPNDAPMVIGENVRYEMLRVDKDVYTALQEQIKRINRILVSQGVLEEKEAGNSMALQVINQVFAEKTDEELKKILKRSALQ